MSRIMATSALVASLAATAYAHGRVISIAAGGKTYDGFLNEYLYGDGPPADLIAWSADNGDNGFVDGTDYGNAANIACHKNGAPGGGVAKVAAGSTVEVTWGPDVWPESHHGPVLDYLAKCAGDDCTSASAADLSFFKIGEAGLDDGSTAPGTWASDDLIAAGGKWSVKIPESLAPGQYVYRNEIIALHSAGDTNGAQNYPQCFNLEVTGSGTAEPESTPADQLYTNTDPGIKISIYTAPIDYTIPGPALWDGASSGGSGSGGSSGGASSAAPAPSSAPAPPTYGGASSAAPISSAPAATSAAYSAPPVSMPVPVPSGSVSYPVSAGTGLPSASGTGVVPYPTEGAPYPITSSPAAPTSSAASPPNYGGEAPSPSSDVPVGAVTESASSAPPAATSPAAPQPSSSYGGGEAPSYGGGEAPSYGGSDAPSYGGSEGSGSEGGYGGDEDSPSLEELLKWTKYYITKGFNADGVHARDVVRRRWVA